MKAVFHTLDWLVLGIYFAGTLGLGAFFYRRTRNAEGFTAANRSLPGWVVGLSIFATYLSSISYLALPGKSFAADWNPFVFSLSIPGVTWIAIRYFLPHYRKSREVSAYALLESRFGLWARLYASFFYLLTQIARIAVVLYLMALPMQVIFGWNIYAILLFTGVAVTLYAFVGGILAVIWTDAIQSVVLLTGALLCLLLMLLRIDGGMGAVLETGSRLHKFSLGSFSADWKQSTFWVVLVYGVVINLQNFGIDQSYVQRYFAAGSDREARKSLWLGSLLYVPVSALFFFIGTSLFVFYGSDPSGPALEPVRRVVAAQQLVQQDNDPADPGFEERTAVLAERLEPAEVGDRVFPWFIASELPAGLTGLLIAAVFAAAMSTISTSLNSSATLLYADYYKRFRPAGKNGMQVLYGGTVLWGILGTALALLLVRLTQSALDMWWTLSGIFGGGMTGLFLLGLISRRAGNAAGISGVLLGVLLILWLSVPALSPQWQPLVHAYLIPVAGTLVILLTGLAVSRLKQM
ncbi:MAG: sodium:solute symporter [Bacteroidales bacterium]